MKKKLFLIVLAFMLSLSLGFSEPPTPCTPVGGDCDVSWSPTYCWYVDFPGDNCTILVYFSIGTCYVNGQLEYSLQILYWSIYGGDCVINSDVETLQTIYELLIRDFNVNGFYYFDGGVPWYPKNVGDCYDYYNITNYSCFFDIIIVPNSPSPFLGLKQVSIPCQGAGCCSQKIRVCKYADNGGLTFQTIGQPYGMGDCSNAVWPDWNWLWMGHDGQPPIAPPPQYWQAITQCLPTCEAVELNGKTDPYPIVHKITDVFTNLIEGLKISVNLDGQLLSLNINSVNQISLVLRINDIMGKEIINYDLGNINSRITKQIDVSEFSSGIYFISFFDKDKYLKTEKFYIIK